MVEFMTFCGSEGGYRGATAGGYVGGLTYTPFNLTVVSRDNHITVSQGFVVRMDRNMFTSTHYDTTLMRPSYSY